jgi:hypothetical protein
MHDPELNITPSGKAIAVSPCRYRLHFEDDLSRQPIENRELSTPGVIFAHAPAQRSLGFLRRDKGEKV